jgi:serine/threonine protein kinase
LHGITGTKSYLAPELTKSLEDNKKECNYDPFKSDIYSCGLVYKEVFDLTNFENNEEIKKKINKIIAKMMETEANLRNSIEEVQKNLEIIEKEVELLGKKEGKKNFIESEKNEYELAIEINKNKINQITEEKRLEYAKIYFE